MRAAAGIVAGLLLAGCAAGPPEAAVVSAVAEGAVLPSLDAAAQAAASLSESIGRDCSEPGAPTEQAKAAWIEAKMAWERAEAATYFGPAGMLRTVSRVDYTPVSESGIDDLLGSATRIDAGFVASRSASTQRGLGAIEYGLFGEPAADDARVCELLVAVSDVVAAESKALFDAWGASFEGAEPWVETFTGGMAADQALGDVIGALVEITKRLSLLELGKGLGISAPTPEPEAIDEGAAQAGAAVYRAQLEGIGEILSTGGESSLLALIHSRDASVAERIDTLVDDTISDLDGIDGSLVTAVGERPDQMTGIYEHLAELRTLFEADVVSLLDITLGFSDTDGDTG